jgi:transposase
MAGRFEGLSDAEWSIFEKIFPKKEKKGPGRPASHPRKVMNSLLYILIVGCRWCDLPIGKQWTSKSSAHRWLKTWYTDGTIDKLKALILGPAQNEGLIDWKSGAVDGSFSPWEGRRG